MEIYCVKDRRRTPNVPNSERFAQTKNGRWLLKAKCAICGTTKNRFVKESVVKAEKASEQEPENLN